MTTPTDPRIDLVARTLDEVALASIEGAVPMATIREAAAELVEKLDAHRDAGADFTPAPEDVEPSPGQVWAQLLQMDPDERIRRLDGLLTSANRGHACWLASHTEQIENLRSTVHVTRAELADVRARTYTDHVLVVSDPDGVLTVPAGTTDDVLDQVRAVVPDGVDVQRAAPQWPAPDIAVDLIDHTDEPVQP